MLQVLLLLLLLLRNAVWKRRRPVETQQCRMLQLMKRSPGAKTEQIWRMFSERLRQFVRSRVESSADADDILQTVFLRIHQRLDQLRHTDRLEPWLFRITRNAVTDHFRKARTIENDGRLEIEASPSSEPRNMNREVANCISVLVDQLPEEQRRAVALYELEGVPQAEIAERESISLSGAKSRIQRGRRNLETMLHACCRFDVDARGNVLDCEMSSGQSAIDGGRCDDDRCSNNG